MEAFSRTFLPAAAEAGIPLSTVSRHMPMLRRCVDAEDPAVLVAACLPPDHLRHGDHLRGEHQRHGEHPRHGEHQRHGEHLLLLTRHRLVVTRQSRLAGRIRLHLNAGLRELTNVVWVPDLRLMAVELAVTASDGLRERFWMKLTDAHRVRRVDLLLEQAFSPRLRLASPPRRHARVPARHSA